VQSWWATSGRFDPTVLRALVAAGYDRSFEGVGPTASTPAESAGPPPGCAGVVLDPVVRAVTLPRSVTLDLGGIGKGFAADVVSNELITAGAVGACVNLGGDLRVRGTPPADGAWIVEIEREPGTAKRGAARWFGLTEGAVATTSSRRRVWQRAGTRMHHVIDPRTGTPVVSPPMSATVVAAEAWRAEVLAKAVFIARSPHEAEALLRSARATGVLVDGAGRIRPLHGFERFLT
jgi:thiamine biosynthesis lipoprotein